MKKLLIAATVMTISMLSTLPAFGAVIFVDPNADFVATGIFLTGGSSLQINSTGTVDIASTDGHYVTDANGTIVTAPDNPSVSYTFFENTTPNGPPVVGGQKFLSGNPYGSLLYGFSAIPNPSTLSDFALGFHLLGTSGSAIAPAGGGYLFLRVNDFNKDNTGGFSADINNGVPEPGTMLMLGSAAVLLGLRRLRQHSRA